MPDKEAEIARLEQEASRLSGIPVEVLHDMTEQEMMEEFVGEPYGPPEEGTYSRKFDV